MYVSLKKKKQTEKQSLCSKLAVGQRDWTSTRRILRSSSVVSVLTYVRLAWGLTDVSYAGTMGDPDRSSDRLVMLADLDIKTKSETTSCKSVTNKCSYSKNSFSNKCWFANVTVHLKVFMMVVYDVITGDTGRRAPRNSLYSISNFCVNLKLFQNNFKRKSLWKDFRKIITGVVHISVIFQRK